MHHFFASQFDGTEFGIRFAELAMNVDRPVTHVPAAHASAASKPAASKPATPSEPVSHAPSSSTEPTHSAPRFHHMRRPHHVRTPMSAEAARELQAATGERTIAKHAAPVLTTGEQVGGAVEDGVRAIGRRPLGLIKDSAAIVSDEIGDVHREAMGVGSSFMDGIRRQATLGHDGRDLTAGERAGGYIEGTIRNAFTTGTQVADGLRRTGMEAFTSEFSMMGRLGLAAFDNSGIPELAEGARRLADKGVDKATDLAHQGVDTATDLAHQGRDLAVHTADGARALAADAKDGAEHGMRVLGSVAQDGMDRARKDLERGKDVVVAAGTQARDAGIRMGLAGIEFANGAMHDGLDAAAGAYNDARDSASNVLADVREQGAELGTDVADLATSPINALTDQARIASEYLHNDDLTVGERVGGFLFASGGSAFNSGIDTVSSVGSLFGDVASTPYNTASSVLSEGSDLASDLADGAGDFAGDLAGGAGDLVSGLGGVFH